MQVLGSDFKKGFCRLKVDSLDDLWVLSQVIDPKDLVKSRTFRKIKLGKEGDRKSNVVKKPVMLTLEVEKVEFHKYSNSLRVAGWVKEGPDDIPLGSHHTIDVEENSVITINKDKWLGFQIEKVKEATSEKVSKVLICVMDRDEACFALMKRYGYEYLSEIKGKVEKKGVEDKSLKEKGFYGQLIVVLEEYVKRYGIEFIIIASPAFWKDDLMKVLKQKNASLASKVTLATCNSFGKNAINEVLKRPEVKSVLKQERVVKETALVEELMVEISKNNLGVYGFDQVKGAAEAGAVKTLLVTDKLIHELREKNEYSKLDSVMRLVDQVKGEIFIISEEHDAGKRLHGLGGIGAVLRYKINY
ncbi:MAG: mRNA surveillance protein pelota [Nanoarchaeota archaeon]|nr:mRNA surveillance protein pelota [Nanoarchaeota archaeon]